MMNRSPLLALGFLCSAAACGTSPANPEVAAGATSAAPADAPTATPTGAPTAAPSAAGAKTPGQVACGETTCDLKTQHCCVASDKAAPNPRCVDKGADGSNPCGEDERLACDDLSDCGSGERCCETYACTSGCPREQVCEKDLCAFGPEEVCLASGTCGPGFTCKTQDGQSTGRCVVAKRTLQCGKATCGEGESCCWDGNEATCAAECKNEPGHDSFACLGRDDCGGYTCGDFAGMPFAVFACKDVGADRSSTILCKSLDECPVHHGNEATGCKPHEDSMPGLLACVYE